MATEEERGTLQRATDSIDLLSYLLWRRGFVLSGKTHRQIATIASSLGIPLKNVEKVISMAVETLLYKVLPSTKPEISGWGVSAADGSVAEKLLKYYVSRDYRTLSGEELRREIQGAAKETGLAPKVVAEILKPIYVGIHRELVEEAFSGELTIS